MGVSSYLERLGAGVLAERPLGEVLDLSGDGGDLLEEVELALVEALRRAREAVHDRLLQRQQLVVHHRVALQAVLVPAKKKIPRLKYGSLQKIDEC